MTENLFLAVLLPIISNGRGYLSPLGRSGSVQCRVQQGTSIAVDGRHIQPIVSANHHTVGGQILFRRQVPYEAPHHGGVQWETWKIFDNSLLSLGNGAV